MKSSTGALIAFIFLLPISILLSGVLFDIQVIEDFFKLFLAKDGEPSLFGRIFMIVALTGLPIAVTVSLIPAFPRHPDGKRRPRILNLIIAFIALAFLVPILYNLGEEIYRCDILGIPNCD